MTTSITPRLVEIGLNLISIFEVSDDSHTFEGNVLYHLFWDCMPLDPKSGAKFFRPWIQVHNIREMRHIRNDGMQQLSNQTLEKKVAEHISKHYREHPSQPIPPCKVYENHNFVGQFVSLLNLQLFPFDQQALRITIMCNPTSQVTFTHRVVRESSGAPKVMRDGKPMRSIKCNLEEDTLSEWYVVAPGGGSLDAELCNPSPALSSYAFIEHDRAFSAEGAVYQRLDFKVYVFREVKSIIYTVLVPSILLSFASLSIFSMDIEKKAQDRLAVLFVIILTLVANQFIVAGRLPHLNYRTWVDWVILTMQFFVYGLVLQTSLCITIANSMNILPRDVDKTCLQIFGGIYACIIFIVFASGFSLYWIRRANIKNIERDYEQSFTKEEQRLEQIKRDNPPRPSGAPLPPPQTIEADHHDHHHGHAEEHDDHHDLHDLKGQGSSHHIVSIDDNGDDDGDDDLPFD
jgi:hypothetical protein